jgi:hypothetical protein
MGFFHIGERGNEAYTGFYRCRYGYGQRDEGVEKLDRDNPHLPLDEKSKKKMLGDTAAALLKLN